jgi:adenine phosphoribosyltransferase
MNSTDLREYIRDVPDFPKPGIVFKDITPLIADPVAFNLAVDLIAERLRASETDEILAIESRGFIFGAAVSAQMSLPLQLVRKSGKLPGETVGMDYELEYGTDRVEIHRGVLRPGRRYGIVDDLIATGGTAAATMRLVREHDADISCCCFLIELGFLGGREMLDGCRIESVIVYD